MTTDFRRNLTGMTPLDHVLGGGLVAASVVLLAGPAGVGKSTLSLQLLAGLGHRCLYASGEETLAHLEERARRTGTNTSPLIFVLSERNLETIFTRAREVQSQTIVVDSLQTLICEDVNGSHGSPAQLKACVSRLVHYAKTNGTTFWVICHVTREGDIAGPKTLQHEVDVVLEMSRGTRLDGAEMALRCSRKNRFGPTGTSGHFELTSKGFVPGEPR